MVIPSAGFGENIGSMEVQEKLNNISEEEKEILKELFVQMQEIDEMERETKRLDNEIESIKLDIESIDERIMNEEKLYDSNLLALKAVLSSYQRMGPGSYLEIVLSSDSLTNLIRRINILRDLSKNTESLLKTIDEGKAKLELEKENLNHNKTNLEDKYKELESSIKIKQDLVKIQEEYLESLQNDKDLYLERLDYISIIMDELKKTLGDFTRGFTKILNEGKFPVNAVKESITLKGIKGTIEEKTFNDIINSFDFMPKMEIRFKEGKIELNSPDKGLQMSGNFQIEDSQIIRFIPEEGTFLDMPLEKGTLDNLFEEGDFTLDFEPLIGKNILKAVDIFNGYMEVLVGIKLF